MKPQIIDSIKRFISRRRPEIRNQYSAEVRRRRAQEAVCLWINGRRWAEDATFSEVAASLGVDKQHLSKIFRRRFGKSFLQWRKETRIKEAKRLLAKDKDMPAALIGEAVGINDKSNFKRQFRDVTGCTPAQWRLKQQRKVGGK